MNWKENTARTIYNLKDNNLGICIHKICGLGEAWFLTCSKLGIDDYNLKTENFNEAVKQSQLIVMEKATEIYNASTDFVKNVYDNNIFSKY